MKKFICIEVLEEGPPLAWVSINNVEVSVELDADLRDGVYHIHPLDEWHLKKVFDKAEELLRTN